MYENFKNISIDEARQRLASIILQQEQIQPTFNFQSYEIFKPINLPIIKPDMYIVSNYGRIFNSKTQRQLIPSTRNISVPWYQYIGLQTVDNKRIILAIHYIVAMHFIPKTDEDIKLGRDCINHINCFKNDSRACNLQWVTKEENNRYAQIMHEYENLVIKPITIDQQSNWGLGKIGESNGMCTKSDELVKQVCELLQEGKTITECITILGLEKTENNRLWISGIKNRKRRTDISKNCIF